MTSYILVVDDDQAIREFVAVVLEDEGYTVKLAKDGDYALDLVSSGDQPGLILLDMIMPNMDGRVFVGKYRELNVPHAPIIMMSAARNAAEALNDLKVTAFLPKPFNLTEMLRIVKEQTT